MQRSTQREQLDAAKQPGSLLPLVTIPYVGAYVCLSLILTGSPKVTNGLFIVGLAVLLVGTSVGPWRGWHPAGGRGAAIAAGSVLAGVAVAALVGQFGVT